MKTFLLDLIPRIQRYSDKLDNLTLLTNTHWVVFDDELAMKVVYIFREKNKQLLISRNGQVEMGEWDYLGNDSLLVSNSEGAFLFKRGFIDQNVLALKIDGQAGYALLLNEARFSRDQLSVNQVHELLSDTYLKALENNLELAAIKTIQSEEQKEELRVQEMILQDKKRGNISVSSKEKFVPTDHKDLESRIEKINEILAPFRHPNNADIIISYCRYRYISSSYFHHSEVVCDLVTKGKLPILMLENLFKSSKNNVVYGNQLAEYLKSKIH